MTRTLLLIAFAAMALTAVPARADFHFDDSPVRQAEKLQIEMERQGQELERQQREIDHKREQRELDLRYPPQY